MRLTRSYLHVSLSVTEESSAPREQRNRDKHTPHQQPSRYVDAKRRVSLLFPPKSRRSHADPPNRGYTLYQHDSFALPTVFHSRPQSTRSPSRRTESTTLSSRLRCLALPFVLSSLSIHSSFSPDIISHFSLLQLLLAFGILLGLRLCLYTAKLCLCYISPKALISTLDTA